MPAMLLGVFLNAPVQTIIVPAKYEKDVPLPFAHWINMRVQIRFFKLFACAGTSAGGSGYA